MHGLRQVSVALATAGVLASSVAQAALFDRGGGLIYDDDLNVTWAANPLIDGRKPWADANSWAAGLTYGGLSGWRLPTPGEFLHLFFAELGGTDGVAITTAHNEHFDLFHGLPPWNFWSSEPSSWHPGEALGVGFNNGRVGQWPKADANGAWAVRTGDVPAVPEPEIWTSMLAGIGLLSFMARRKKLA